MTISDQFWFSAGFPRRRFKPVHWTLPKNTAAHVHEFGIVTIWPRELNQRRRLRLNCPVRIARGGTINFEREVYDQLIAQLPRRKRVAVRVYCRATRMKDTMNRSGA